MIIDLLVNVRFSVAEGRLCDSAGFVVNRIYCPFELKAHRGHSLRKLPVRFPTLTYGGRPAVNVLQTGLNYDDTIYACFSVC